MYSKQNEFESLSMAVERIANFPRYAQNIFSKYIYIILPYIFF